MTGSREVPLLWDSNQSAAAKVVSGKPTNSENHRSTNPDVPGHDDLGHGKTPTETSKSAPTNVAGKRRRAKWEDTIGEEGLTKLSTRQDVSKDDLKRVAKIKHDFAREKAIRLIAGGSSVSEALSLAYLPDNTIVVECGEDVMPKPDDELTDAEWFERHCGNVSPALKNAPAYKRDALSYRRTMEALRQLGSAVRPEVRARRNDKLPNGGYHFLLFHVAQVSHPKHWLACGPCGGKGTSNDRACQCCYGAGFKIHYEPLKK